MTWNNVKDKMPTEFDKYGNSIRYLVYEKWNDTPFIGYYNNVRKNWNIDTSNYDTNGNAIVIGNILSNDVTHWMELPEEPKEN